MKPQILSIITAAGATAGIAAAQTPFMISGSGATLQENLFRATANTNDFIDIDGDNNALGVNGARDNAILTGYWDFHYRLTGSGNGIAELDTFGDVNSYFVGDSVAFTGAMGFMGTNQTVVDGDRLPGSRAFDMCVDGSDDFAEPALCSLAADPEDILGNSAFADDAIFNLDDLVIAGDLQVPPGNSNHRSGAPFLTSSDNFPSSAARAVDPSAGFIVDFSASDVPLSWFGIVATDDGTPVTPRFDATPGSPGYGFNTTIAVSKDGVSTGFTNLLRPLNVLNSRVGNPNGQTVFDTSISITPVAAIVNYGLGLEEVDMSNLRHANVTGRFITGENVVVITRDSGSGTRNAFMNGIALDPSWGAGENVGDRSTSSVNDLLGPNFTPSNKGGSSRMEGTAQNHRLAIGHTGAERGIGRWLDTEELEVLAVRSDLKGGTVFARPTLDNALDGGPNGYNINGPAAFSTVGNPRSLPADLGGFGYLEPFTDENDNGEFDAGEEFIDINGDSVRGSAEPVGAVAPTAPATPNPQVGAYINNITRSIQAIVEDPEGDINFFSPGEFLATNFLLVAAVSNVPEPSLTTTQPIPLIPNEAFNNAVADGSATQANTLSNTLYATFNSDSAGVAPTRTSGLTYSDGLVGGGSYLDQNGDAVGYGSLLGLRNKIAGDFDGDGTRDLVFADFDGTTIATDAVEMLEAYNDRGLVDADGLVVDARADNSTWDGNGDLGAVIEILGDFDGDGNFDANDLRYWADGLALVENGLDVLPIVGSDTSGDGLIDTFTQGDGVGEKTLDRQVGFTQIDLASLEVLGDVNFFETALATGVAYEAGDSRADIAGSPVTPNFAPIGFDGIVDDQDIDYVVANFADFTDLSDAANASGTGLAAEVFVMDLSCDMNGDLACDESDVLAIIEDILETELGDVNLDGVADANDRVIIEGNLNTAGGFAAGDLNFDGIVNDADLAIFDDEPTGCNAADLNGDGLNTLDDILVFTAAFDVDNPSDVADLNGDGLNTLDDILVFTGIFDTNDPNCTGN